MTEFTQHWVDAAGVRLSVLRLGEPTLPPLIMLHGMRDVAWSLMPVARQLSERYCVYLPELRGHGASDQPGWYSIDHFLFDLHQLMATLEIPQADIFGHSLGGQILARFAAIFPGRVRRAVIVEGLGPPARPGEDDDASEIAGYGPHLVATFEIPQRQRALPDLEFAATRLLANNPRLDPGLAPELARAATRAGDDGRLIWAFDPRVRSVFVGVRRRDSERYWRQVRCPTLIISGALADEYWRGQMGDRLPGWTGRFAPGELEARVACFGAARLVEFERSGHMVHYDEPDRLAAVVREFLQEERT